MVIRTRGRLRVSRKFKPKNALGPAIKEIREEHGWTLEQAILRLRHEGLECSVERLDKIESQRVRIRDYEVFYFSAALGVSQERLWQCLARRKA